MILFKNRQDAGQKLGEKLRAYRNNKKVIILALPRGGVPVGFEVAKSLNVMFNIFLVRKLGVPGHEELAMGAVASGGKTIINEKVIDMLNISDQEIEEVLHKEQTELERREKDYRGDISAPEIRGKIIILIDDGLATGASMRAAVLTIREYEPAKIIAAVPTASPESCEEFRNEVDEMICVYTPASFKGVGQWYDDFSQTSDQEVKDLILRASCFGRN